MGRICCGEGGRESTGSKKGDNLAEEGDVRQVGRIFFMAKCSKFSKKQSPYSQQKGLRLYLV